MNGNIFVFLIIIGFFILSALFVGGFNIWWNYQQKKFAKKYPDYLELKNKVIEKGNANWDWYDLINQKKKAIDEALATMPYLTKTAREKVEKQIEIWQIELEAINEEARPHFEEHIILREKFNKWHDELVASGELKEF